MIHESNSVLLSRLDRIVLSEQQNNYESSRYLLALSISAIQDFYSNTNWVEMKLDDINKKLGRYYST